MSEQMILGMLLAQGSVALIIAAVCWVLQIIANWKIFTKAGEAGWKSVIPVYSGYISYKIAWNPGMFWIGLICTVYLNYLNLMMEQPDTIWISIGGAAAILSAVINIIFVYRLAKVFGKGIGFVFGLLFLQPVFILILGLGSAEYQGNTGTKE